MPRRVVLESPLDLHHNATIAFDLCISTVILHTSLANDLAVIVCSFAFLHPAQIEEFFFKPKDEVLHFCCNKFADVRCCQIISRSTESHFLLRPLDEPCFYVLDKLRMWHVY